MTFALAAKVPDGCNCGGRRWEGRGEERNMADGGGQMAADRRPRWMCLLSSIVMNILLTTFKIRRTQFFFSEGPMFWLLVVF